LLNHLHWFCFFFFLSRSNVVLTLASVSRWIFGTSVVSKHGFVIFHFQSPSVYLQYFPGEESSQALLFLGFQRDPVYSPKQVEWHQPAFPLWAVILAHLDIALVFFYLPNRQPTQFLHKPKWYEYLLFGSCSTERSKKTANKFVTN